MTVRKCRNTVSRTYNWRAAIFVYGNIFKNYMFKRAVVQ